MKKIKGVTLLELMLVAGIIAIGTLMSLWNKQADLEQQQSLRSG
ncbi:prepilin-type N-terminal cleavage/methylation domain-containing protein (plasmid) [Pseudomonas sp. Leaf58]|nr:prepilin-type N-terminal cleavage/methylation domain-containing protein [Pseudomonas sp. Leaf58]AYG47768.1 prepilin-type N-terminal cleavage/methylation domain-containing protein [Pseudomonas sp. Leaf58]